MASLLKPIINVSFEKRSKDTNSYDKFMSANLNKGYMLNKNVQSYNDRLVSGSFIPFTCRISYGSLSPLQEVFYFGMDAAKNSTVTFDLLPLPPDVKRFFDNNNISIGEMITFVAVVADTNSRVVVPCFCRWKRTSDTEYIEETNYGWRSYYIGNFFETGYFKFSGANVLGFGNIHSVVAGSSYKVSTQNYISRPDLDVITYLGLQAEQQILVYDALNKKTTAQLYTLLQSLGWNPSNQALLDPDSLPVDPGVPVGPTPPTPGPDYEEYSLNIGTQPAIAGTAVGMGYHDANVPFTIKAIPNPGWKFDHWDDGETSAERIIILTADRLMTAYFVADISSDKVLDPE